MNLDLAKEVAAMLNIEAGAPTYRVEPYDQARACVLRDVLSNRGVRVDGHGDQLVVAGVAGHPRGFRFKRLENKKPEERFAWGAIHARCSKLAEEVRARGAGRR